MVFNISGVPEASEVSKLKWFPKEDSVSVVYLDSFDELRKVKKGYQEILSGTPSQRHKDFEGTCASLKLPLSQAKRLVGAVHGSLQGGDFDGVQGSFQASHDKKLSVMALGMGLLGSGTATEFELRHFVGKVLFCMAFRRCAMSCLESVFVDMEKSERGQRPLSRRTLEEIYVSMVLLPLLVMNLRAPFDPEVTIADASPEEVEQFQPCSSTMLTWSCTMGERATCAGKR